jgi:hypothetical protein
MFIYSAYSGYFAFKLLINLLKHEVHLKIFKIYLIFHKNHIVSPLLEETI